MQRKTEQADATEAMPATLVLPFRPHLLGLDFVRGWSAVAVVMLHACVPYSNPSMPGLDWSVTDRSSVAVTHGMWAIEIVIMPIFLVIAGFLAASGMARRGPKATFRGRVSRLGVPLALGMMFLLPIDFYVWLCGWVAEGKIAAGKLKSLKFDGIVDANLWGLCHLWFLQYLITFVGMLALIWKPIRRLEPMSTMRWGVICVLGSIICLTLHPEVVWGFQHAFFPVASKWVYSGCFFMGGVVLFLRDPHLIALPVLAPRLIYPGVLLLISGVLAGVWRLAVARTESFAANLLVSGLTVASAWLLTLGLIGAASVWTSRRGGLDKVSASFAAGSFWIYLLHHPVVGLTHITLKFGAEALAPEVKMMLATVSGVGISWACWAVWHHHAERDSATVEDKSGQGQWIPERRRAA